MEDKIKNDRKKYTILLIICTALGTIMILAGLYFTFIKKDDKPVDNGENNKQEQVVDNKLVDNKEYKFKNFDEYIKGLKQNSGVKKVEYEYNDTERPYEVQLFTYPSAMVKISETGTLTIDFEEKDDITISNVTNAKSIERVDMETAFYIITDNGEVYYYSLVENNIDKATKVVNINNAYKFVEIVIFYKDALGGDNIIGVVDKDNNFTTLWGIAN